MRIDRESFIRFAVAVALACYDLPADRAMTSEEAAQLVKGGIDMALGPDASNVQVEPMENYPASSNVKFRSPVKPGDTVETQCHIKRAKHPFYFAEGSVSVDERLCVSAEFSFAITGV